MKKLTTLLAALLFVAPLAHADTYAMLDNAGTLTFTDKPAKVAPRSSAGAMAAGVGMRQAQRETASTLTAADLAGTWRATSHDGEHTRFEVRQNGSFVYDSRATRNNERTYMCGRLDINEDVVSMALSTVKRRDADGVIEQLLGDSSTQARLVSADDHRLVLNLEGRTMVFLRVVG